MKWNQHIDRIGMMVSSLCAVHCCLMPFVIGILPLIGAGYLAAAEFEWLMIGLAALLGGCSAVSGYRLHNDYTAVMFYGFGILMLVLNRIIHAALGVDCCSIHNAFMQTETAIPWQAIPSVIGGMLVAASHFVNQHLCKRHVFCQVDCCASAISLDQ